MGKSQRQLEKEEEARIESKDGTVRYVTWNGYEIYIVTVMRFDGTDYSTDQWQTVAAFLNGKKLNEKDW